MRILCLFALFSLAVASKGIKHVHLDGADLVETSPDNFAISSPILFEKRKWIAVSLNGDEVYIMTRACDTVPRSFKALDDKDQELIISVQKGLSLAGLAGYPVDEFSDHIVTKFDHEGKSSTVQTIASGMKTRCNSFKFEGASIHKQDDQFSVSGGRELPGTSRMFSLRDMLVFVHYNGDVSAQVKNCLSHDQSKIIKKFYQQTIIGEEEYLEDLAIFRDNMDTLRKAFKSKKDELDFKLQLDLEEIQAHFQQSMADSRKQFKDTLDRLKDRSDISDEERKRRQQQAKDDLQAMLEKAKKTKQVVTEPILKENKQKMSDLRLQFDHISESLRNHMRKSHNQRV